MRDLKSSGRPAYYCLCPALGAARFPHLVQHPVRIALPSLAQQIVSCLKTPESSTLDIPAWFMLMGRFAGSRSSRRPESRDASACSTVIASAAVVVPGPPSPTVRFAPGHVTPMTQVSGTNELMTQIHDA
jgi:hypothetical protein